MRGGLVVDPWPPERGRQRPERLVAIATLTEADPQQALLSLLSGDPGWVDLDRFALARGLAARVAAALWRPMNFSACGSQRHFVRLRLAQMASAGTGDRDGLGGLS